MHTILRLRVCCAAVACLVSLSALCYADPFEAMQKSFEVMEKEMHGMMTNMQRLHAGFFDASRYDSAVSGSHEGAAIAIERQDDKSTKVTVSGITDDQFDATFGNDELSIKTPTAKIELSFNQGVLAVSVEQEIKEDARDAKGGKKYRSFTNSCFSTRVVTERVDLENSSISYSKDSKALTIVVPAKDAKAIKEEVKKIPVSVK